MSMCPDLLEARAMLRARMHWWPDVDAETVAFLDSLPWQERESVIQVYGHQRDVDYAACELAVAERTLRRYLQSAYEKYAKHVA